MRESARAETSPEGALTSANLATDAATEAAAAAQSLTTLLPTDGSFAADLHEAEQMSQAVNEAAEAAHEAARGAALTAPAVDGDNGDGVGLAVEDDNWDAARGDDEGEAEDEAPAPAVGKAGGDDKEEGVVALLLEARRAAQ